MKRLPYFLFFALTTCVLAFLLLPNTALPEKGGWRDFSEAAPGHVFIAGQAPKLLGIKPYKTPVLKDGRYHIRYYVVFKRAELDDGSSRIPIIKGGMYRQLILCNNKQLQWLAKQVRPAKWNERYPTWYANLRYTLFYPREEGGRLASNTGGAKKKQYYVYEREWETPWSLKRVRKKKLKTKYYWEPGPREARPDGTIEEYLIRGLKPGTYRLEIRCKAKADEEHIFGKLLWFYDWAKFLFKPIKDLTDWATHVKRVVKSGVKGTRSIYYIHVPAIVPDLKPFKRPSDAVQEIRAWSLRAAPVKEETSKESLHGKIVSQWPRPGAWVKKGSEVRFRYYAYKKPVAKPWKPMTLAPKYNISGTWRGGGRSVYRVKQERNIINWEGSGFYTGRKWHHKAEGTITGNKVSADWEDLRDSGFYPNKGSVTGTLSPDGKTITWSGDFNPLERKWTK